MIIRNLSLLSSSYNQDNLTEFSVWICKTFFHFSTNLGIYLSKRMQYQTFLVHNPAMFFTDPLMFLWSNYIIFYMIFQRSKGLVFNWVLTYLPLPCESLINECGGGRITKIPLGSFLYQQVFIWSQKGLQNSWKWSCQYIGVFWFLLLLSYH